MKYADEWNKYYNEYKKAYNDFKNNNFFEAKERLVEMREELEDLSKKESSWEDPINNCIRWLGIIEMESNEYQHALKLFSELVERINQKKKFDISFDLELEPGKKENEESLIALTYHDLGFVYICLKDYSKAEDNIKIAIEKIENDKSRLSTKAWFLNDLGLCYFEWGKFDQAIEQYDKVLKLDLKDPHLIGYPYFYRGLALFLKGDLIRARESLSEAENHFRGTEKSDQSELVIASILINIGRIDLKNEDYDRAKKDLDDAQEIYGRDSIEKYINSLTVRNRDKEKNNKDALKILQGVFYYKKDDYENAEKKLKEVKSAKAYNNLGCVYYGWSKKEKNKTDILTEANRFVNRIKDKGKSTAEEIPENYLERAKHFFEEAKIASEQDKDESTRITAQKNLNIASQKKIGTESQDWWSWWSSSTVKSLLCSSFVALLIVSLTMGLFIIPVYFNPGNSDETITVTINNSDPSLNTTEVLKETNTENRSQKTAGAQANETRESSIINTTTRETLYQQITTTQKTTRKNAINPETILLFSAFIFMILIHPLIKSFSAGSVKLDLKDEPKITTSGASASTGPDVRV
jgi:tetratricopeptide (TPR) repeat protein